MKRSDIAGYPRVREYPKIMYHATEKPQMVKDEFQEYELQEKGWSESYIHQEYPKAVVDKDGNVTIQQSPEGEPAPSKKKG